MGIIQHEIKIVTVILNPRFNGGGGGFCNMYDFFLYVTL